LNTLTYNMIKINGIVGKGKIAFTGKSLNRLLFVIYFLFRSFYQPAFAQDRENLMKSNTLINYPYQTQTMELSNGVTMGYVDEGQGAETLIFVHGLGANSSHWKYNIEELKESFRCVAVDLPGYWSSRFKYYDEADYMEFFATSILEFVDSLGVQQPSLIGHSMGGQVCMVAAIREPQKFRRLILVAPAGIETFTHEESEQLKNLYKPELLMQAKEASLRYAFNLNFHEIPETVEDLIQERLALMEHEGFEVYCRLIAKGVNGMLDHPVRHQLKQLELPTLIVYGENEKLIPNPVLHPHISLKEMAEQAKNDLKDGELVFLPRSGHMLMYERPADFNEILKDYLNKTIPMKTQIH